MLLFLKKILYNLWSKPIYVGEAESGFLLSYFKREKRAAQFLLSRVTCNTNISSEYLNTKNFKSLFIFNSLNYSKHDTLKKLLYMVYFPSEHILTTDS